MSRLKTSLVFENRSGYIRYEALFGSGLIYQSMYYAKPLPQLPVWRQFLVYVSNILNKTVFVILRKLSHCFSLHKKPYLFIQSDILEYNSCLHGELFLLANVQFLTTMLVTKNLQRQHVTTNTPIKNAKCSVGLKLACRFIFLQTSNV